MDWENFAAQRNRGSQETLMEKLLPQRDSQAKGTCPQHRDRAMDFYCGQHSQLCCDKCRSTDHRSCTDVKSVKELSRNITGNKDFKNFSYRLATVKNKTEEILKDTDEKLKLVNENHEEIVDAVKKMRLELNEALDKVEEKVLQKARQFKEKEVAKVKAISDKYGQTRIDMSNVIKQLETYQQKNQVDEMFVLMKEVERKLKAAEANLADVDNDVKVKGFMFLPDVSLTEMLKNPDAMGKFLPHIWTERAGEVRVRTGLDTCRCWVTSMAALPDKLVVADCGNNKVKAISTSQLSVMSELSLLSPPWAVTKVSDQQVAVTVPYMKKIIVIRTEASSLTQEKEIGTSHKCHGIAHWDGKFMLTFNKKDKVEIIDMTGAVLHIIATDIIKQKLFSFPEYSTLSPNNQLVYISNFLSDSVACIGLGGTIKGVYKDSELTKPRQTVVDRNGLVFICGYGSRNIHLITMDLRKIKVLPTGGEKLGSPRAICLSQEGDRLFVDQSPDNVGIFRVSSFLNARTPKLTVVPEGQDEERKVRRLSSRSDGK